jgi:predicted dithiol-disulfide oxidoreductase (DUF899 family)
MTDHKTGTREEWLAARLDLLAAEKALTRRSDELARQRQELPWVRIDKQYRFQTDAGTASLADLFGGRSQLRLYHFMFGPTMRPGARAARRSRTASTAPSSISRITTSRSARCHGLRWRNCRRTSSGWAGVSPGHLHSTATSTTTSTRRTPRSNGSPERSRPTSARPTSGHPVRKAPGLDAFASSIVGTDWATYRREGPGVSAFTLDDGVVYHTYSAYACGLDGLWGMYQWLDRAPLGRNETGHWWRRHDEYDNQ